jgi:adenylate cyclase
MRRSLSLGQVFLATIPVLAALLGLLSYLILQGSRQSVIESSRSLLEATGSFIGDEIESYLGGAQKAIDDVERQIRYGACHAEDALSVESHLFAGVLNDPNLAEIAFTHAVKLGYDADLQMRVSDEGRWQVSVFREGAGDGSPIHTRFTYKEKGRFVSDLRRRAGGAGLRSASNVRMDGAPPDPTEHLTFKTTASSTLYGHAVWSDLSYTELDERLPEPQQRVVVTVMKAVEDQGGRFVGVVRVAILTREIDRKIKSETEKNKPSRIFLCDNDGRLVSRGNPSDRLVEQSDQGLRPAPADLAPEVARALHDPALATVSADQLLASGRFETSGRNYLVSFKGLPKTQGWRVGVLAAEDELRGIAGLLKTRDRLVFWSLFVIGWILAGGTWIVRAVQGGLARIVDSTARMRSFDFAPLESHSMFRDVEAVMQRLELAKTAMRAMGKYVPIDLVRLLYQTGREPILGGELAEVSLMFTDIKDFTTLSEQLSPNDLARVLGRYLEVMTTAIHAERGTIDKYIGDAIMAVWNVPTACPGHAARACAAALACVRAGEALFAAPEWHGKPLLTTRFGLHRDEVMVGHFGSPDRMSFTALGDGVNLASRLEGLNKQYGTTILASETIVEQAKPEFVFRLLDVVAVKGKTKGIRVYELLGDAGVDPALLQTARAYEQALEAYLARDFQGALQRLQMLAEDAPSRVLAERCRSMIADPPGADWNGIYVSKTK